MSGTWGHHPTDHARARSADVVVIGGGIAGVSVAAELARDRTVLLVEAEPGLARHTTGRSAASYIAGHGPPPTRALIAASRARFDALADEAGHPFLRPRPVLQVAHDDGEERLLRARIAELDVLTELDPAETHRCWPALRPDLVRAAAVIPGACDADPIGLHDHYRRTLRRRGGTIGTSTAVVGLARRRVRLGSGSTP